MRVLWIIGAKHWIHWIILRILLNKILKQIQIFSLIKYIKIKEKTLKDLVMTL
jgi:hypothetical protein